MEKWHIVNHGFIPKGRYYTKLEHGESRGLIIYLEDDDYLIVTLDYFIDIITSGHIDVCVEILKTHEKKYLTMT